MSKCILTTLFCYNNNFQVDDTWQNFLCGNLYVLHLSLFRNQYTRDFNCSVLQCCVCVCAADTTDAGIGSLECVVEHQGSKIASQSVERKTGVYELSFVPKSRGTHFITVKFNGRDVRGESAGRFVEESSHPHLFGILLDLEYPSIYSYRCACSYSRHVY